MATLKQFARACNSVEAMLQQRDVEIWALKGELRTAKATNGALKRRAEAAEKRAKAADKELEICQSELRVKNSKLARYARSIIQLKKELSDLTRPIPKQAEPEDKSKEQADDYHPLTNQIWDGREKSRLVRYLMLNASGPRLTHADIAKCLGTKTNYANNKITRNSFSVEDIVRIAKRAGYTVGIFKDGTNAGVTLGFNPETKRLTIERSNKEET